MQFTSHVREFIGGPVDATEARDLAMAVIADSIRSHKVAITKKLWLAREASRAGDPVSSTRYLDSARELKRTHDCACREYQAAVQATATDSDHAQDGSTER